MNLKNLVLVTVFVAATSFAASAQVTFTAPAFRPVNHAPAAFTAPVFAPPAARVAQPTQVRPFVPPNSTSSVFTPPNSASRTFSQVPFSQVQASGNGSVSRSGGAGSAGRVDSREAGSAGSSK